MYLNREDIGASLGGKTGERQVHNLKLKVDKPRPVKGVRKA